ncbi:MAG: hypothetical protein JST58_17020 [Bacteroidetes bacterium]|nr:hypothetical protein [Bacteroidota bacterium]
MKKNCLLPAFLLFMCLLSRAQSIKYSDFLPGYISKFNFYIVGKVGNSIQVWKTPKNIYGKNKKNSTASIYIFSPDLKLLDEKAIQLDGSYQLPVSVDFRRMGNVYDASVNYIYGNDIVKRDMWRIGEDGNSVDYTSGTEDPNGSEKKENEFPIRQSMANANGGSRFQVFTAKNKAGADSLDLSDNLLIVQKIYEDTLKESKQIQFRAIGSGFGRPGIIQDDNGSIWVFALKKPDSSDVSLEHISGTLSLFVAKLDSNLKVASSAAKFLDIKPTELSYKINYWIQQAFVKDNSLYLICLGARSIMYSARYGVRLIAMVPPQSNAVRGYPIETLDILQIDDSIKCRSDLSLTKEMHDTHLYLSGSFYTQIGKESYFFILQEFRNNVYGIKVFHINGSAIKEMDIQADPHNMYGVPDTYRLDEHHFLIPFFRKGKMAFMKWTNEGL